MFLNEAEIKRIKDAFTKTWTRSFWPLFAFLCGILVGVLSATSDITNDCRFAGSFRVDTQAFTCQRKL